MLVKHLAVCEVWQLLYIHKERAPHVYTTLGVMCNTTDRFCNNYTPNEYEVSKQIFGATEPYTVIQKFSRM